MQILRFDVGDKLVLKKKHPCGFDTFTVLRGGTDVRIVCDGCGRDMTLMRTALEQSVKTVIKTKNSDL